MFSINNIRQIFRDKLQNEDFVVDKTGSRVIEIIGAQFLANESSIFGKVNSDWNRRELNWYLTMSRNVYTIEEPVPEIWRKVADINGNINSNYGWCILSKDNGSQYDNVLAELKRNPFSRRAQMIYTRPTMHSDFNKDGMQDFMCCSNTIHQIRDGKLISLIYFRSNDAIFGYKGDYHWANYVHEKLANDLQIEAGDIIWDAASLHIYERHWNLIN